MKKRFWLPYILLVFLFLVSCSPRLSDPLPPQSFSEVFGKIEEKTEETRENEAPLSSTTASVSSSVQQEHSHQWTLLSSTASTCIQEGVQTLHCSCGKIKREKVAKTPHIPTEATCTSPSVCSVCGVWQSAALGHTLSSGSCTRCHTKLQSPVFVLGVEIGFDESVSSVQEKLGTPTEIITEKNLVSLVYATDLSRLTVIQTDENGLWGVFTMDPLAQLSLDGKSISLSTFSGIDDLNSDAYYQDVGSCRVFAFKDAVGTGEYYAMWMRYSECRYDYINDPRLSGNFYGQNRLSFYYVNALRKKNGLSPLLWSDEAFQVATEYSEHMIRQGFFDHDGSYGERLKEKGIFWWYAGENISQGYYNALFVSDAYYNSQGHRENILKAEFTHVGVGYALSSASGSVFGAQIYYSLAQ